MNNEARDVIARRDRHLASKPWSERTGRGSCGGGLRRRSIGLLWLRLRCSCTAAADACTVEMTVLISYASGNEQHSRQHACARAWVESTRQIRSCRQSDICIL